MILRINMTTQRTYTEEIPHDYFGLGGRGLTSIMINNEVPADCNPLGPDNRLFFAPGFLTGTPLVNTGRLSDDRLPSMFYQEKLSLYHGTVSYTGEELDATLELFTQHKKRG